MAELISLNWQYQFEYCGIQCFI